MCFPRGVPDEFADLITHVRKVTRLREVRALQGFTRLDGAPDPNVPTQQKLCALAPTRLHWLPAIEVIGEGMFMAFDRRCIGGLVRRRARAESQKASAARFGSEGG